MQRLNYPKLCLKNKSIILSWPVAFDLFFSFIIHKAVKFIEAVVGNFADLETVSCIKEFFTNFGCSNLKTETILNFSSDFRFSYLLNTTITSLEQASLVLLLGTNLRIEAPLLNSRIRKNFLFNNKHLLIYSFGLAVDY